MPYIVVFRNNEKTHEYEISQIKKMRIGRGGANDIIVPDAAVSGVHAEIESDGNFFYITDFQSRNGTFVNRELVISRRLNHNDVIMIGNHNLKFIYKKNEKMPSPKTTLAEGSTMHIDTPHHRSRIARSVAEFAGQDSRNNWQGMLNLLRSDCKPLYLDKPVVTIGKDPGCDIVVKGWFVAGNAAEIKMKEDGYYLVPVSGRSPFVNTRSIRSEVRLREFDMIQVGSTTMQFQYHRKESTEPTENL